MADKPQSTRTLDALVAAVQHPVVFPGTAADAAMMAARRHERMTSARLAASAPSLPHAAAQTMRVSDLRAQAKALGVTGVSRLRKAELISRINTPSHLAQTAVAASEAAAEAGIKSAGRFLLRNALPIGIAGAALVAAGRAAHAGQSPAQIAQASGQAAFKAAAPAVAVGTGIYALAQAAPIAAKIAATVLTKAALPLTAAVAAAGAVAGYRKTGTAAGAALGAADTLTGGAATYLLREARGYAKDASKFAGAYLNPAAAAKDRPAAALVSASPRQAATPSRAYKDQWTDRNGVSRSRHDFDIRKVA